MNARHILLLVTWTMVWVAPCHAVSWTPGWIDAPPAEASASAGSRERWDEAHRLGGAIDSPASARAAIVAWEKIAAIDPGNAEPWTELACLNLLEGAAYRTERAERLACYIATLRAAERAMATNPDFLRKVTAGATVWEAARLLGERAMGAMHFWSTAIFYIFRDCLGFFGRVRNAELLKGVRAMLERMDAIDPAWEESTTTFSWAIYYFATPVALGGDRTKARNYFERAVELGVNRTLPRWGRGKYFHAAAGDTAAARADLEAVASRALDGLGGNRSWNRYFKNEAAEILKK